MFELATARAVNVMSVVSPEELCDATPCADWNVQQLIDHMVAGSDYLQAALTGEPEPARTDRTAEDYRWGLEQLRSGLRVPGALERTCMSPLGFEWTVSHAVRARSWMP